MTRVFPLAALLVCGLAAMPLRAEDEVPSRPDLMSFAQGVLPVGIALTSDALRTGMEQAVSAIDGNPAGFTMTPRPGTASDVVEITYALPAPTRFDRFAVPNVFETRSPSQTFFRSVDVFGATQSADGPFVPLATGTLAPHQEEDQATELSMVADQPEVLWIRLRLQGGLDILKDQTFFEFSELVAQGSQQPAPLSEAFTGVWKGKGVNIELAQSGARVTGCYDKLHRLSGTVEGNVLRAIGTSDAGIVSQFILIATENGTLRGLRSTNGAPFRIYEGTVSDAAPVCTAPEPPRLGCGSILHGIGFDFDSDAIRADSRPLLADLHSGLSGETAGTIEIIGHSSSEGSAAYNRDLSQRRAAAVVAALVELGLEGHRMRASGQGEDAPIASNEDEAGRSLNRRVEIRCTG